MEKILSNTYELGALLGSGGMGSVYEARHVRTNQRVAVKVIARVDRRDQQSLHRFEREAKAVARLKTPHIVSVLDTGYDEELGPFTVMEFLKGRDLDALVDELGPLPPTLALKISAQIALGLKAAHAANIIHRDIKPANVFLESAGGDLIVCRILDFGIAKILGQGEFADTGLTNSGSMMGSPRYMSPEQARRAKHADHRADIWSLGVTVYKSLSGVTPTDHLESMADLIISLCQEPARPLQTVAPWVEPDVASLVHACLAIEPTARLQTVDAWLDSARELLPSGFDIHARDLVPLAKEARDKVATRVAVPGFSTAGTPLVRSYGDALAATENAAGDDVPTRVEGKKPSSESSASKSTSKSASVAPMTPRLEESMSSQPTSSAVAPAAPRRVWTYAIAGAALSIVAGIAVVRLTSDSGGASAATSNTSTNAHAATPPASTANDATTAAPPLSITASPVPSLTSATSATSATPSSTIVSSTSPTPPPTTPAATPTAKATTTPVGATTMPKGTATTAATAPKGSTGSGELKGTFE